MEAHQVVPEILATVPPHVVTVKYAPGVEMKLGNELTPLQVKEAPIGVSYPTEPKALYTVIFTDPDAPSREAPLFREILHWLVINVPGKDLAKGTTIAEYAGSGPPEGAGLHRYVLTVYKQSGALQEDQFSAFKSHQGRFKFNTNNFAAAHNLGSPIAGNFFQAQVDDFSRAKHADRLAAALKSEEVIPDILDSPPQYGATVLYSSGAFMHSGNELTPTQVKDIPVKVAWKAEPNALYTVIYTDACGKGPETAKFREILHWLVVNIPGTDISKGETFAEYIGSGPPKVVGLHRYVVLIYKQSGKLNLKREKATKTSMTGRHGFNTRSFVKENGLQGPVAGNFHLAQYDDYVPVLWKQLNVEGSPDSFSVNQ